MRSSDKYLTKNDSAEQKVRPSQVANDNQDHTFKKNLTLLFMVVAYILFNLCASAIFIKLEKKATEGQPHWLPAFKDQFLNNHSDCLSELELENFLKKLEDAILKDSVSIVGNTTLYPEQWNLNSAFFLSVTIASTIGYGTLTPVTAGGQVFASLYALVSIPFTGILAAKIGIATAYYIELLFSRLLNLLYKIDMASLTFTIVVGVLVYIFMPTCILYFISNEEEWTFVNCFYCVIITLTTIGFGDFVPDPDEEGGFGASVLIVIWVISGLAWFATIIQLISTQLAHHAENLGKTVEEEFQESNLMFKLGVTGQNTDMPSNSQNVDNTNLNNSDQEALADSVLRRTRESDVEILGPGAFHAAIMSQTADGRSTRGNSRVSTDL